jgi:uncharacterized membrane protein YeaQ/YmgE (transglycosylase-associated protein family)
MPFGRSDVTCARFAAVRVAPVRVRRLAEALALGLAVLVAAPSPSPGQRIAPVGVVHRSSTPTMAPTPESEGRANRAFCGFVIGAVGGALGAFLINGFGLSPAADQKRVYMVAVSSAAVVMALYTAYVESPSSSPC